MTGWFCCLGVEDQIHTLTKCSKISVGSETCLKTPCSSIFYTKSQQQAWTEFTVDAPMLMLSMSMSMTISISMSIIVSMQMSMLNGGLTSTIVGLLKIRFILPCKNDCQPIFLKKQGSYSLYAKLWLVRPLIKNIPDSSHWYLSNVTFRASLAFQTREEYVFEFFCWKLDLNGGKYWRYAISNPIYTYF